MNSLVCLGKILEYLDKWFVIDEILPFLQQIPSREPAVLMGILGKQTVVSPLLRGSYTYYHIISHFVFLKNSLFDLLPLYFRDL